MAFHVEKFLFNYCCRNLRFSLVFPKISFSYFHTSVRSILFRKYSNIDYSKVPALNEKDLTEQFIRGSGPGGQAVSKTNNCCMLLHVPTGLRVKCHETRSLETNRARAREILTEKLDAMINGDDSVQAQKNRIDVKRIRDRKYRRDKLSELKRQWKIRENLL